ncbi:hypothetical protein IMZ48_25390 [Candidatus Bathyarchaeota archaeon]|nr:hypothetical protein [Candidatus Bathyarchaeota archaeon]
MLCLTASFNEKLLLSNGLCISPIKNGDGPQQTRSLREATANIDNDKDLSDYLMAHHAKVPLGHGEPKYERNPVSVPSLGPGRFISTRELTRRRSLTRRRKPLRSRGREQAARRHHLHSSRRSPLQSRPATVQSRAARRDRTTARRWCPPAHRARPWVLASCPARFPSSNITSSLNTRSSIAET